MGQPIRDDQGKVLGYFLTEAELDKVRADLELAEFERRVAVDRLNGVSPKWDGTNGKTTADAIAWLKSLRGGGAAA